MWAIDGEKCGANCLQAFWTWTNAVYPRKTVKLVLYLLECQVFERTHCCCSGSLWVMGFFHTALQRRFLSLLANITTMKSPPTEGCAGIKARVQVFVFFCFFL